MTDEEDDGRDYDQPLLSDRETRALGVFCINCKAEPNEPCKTRLGVARERPHWRRISHAEELTPKAQSAPIKLGPARLAHAIAKEAASRGVSITYLGERGAPADPDRHGVDYWIWHVCSRGSVLIEFQRWQTDFPRREAQLLLDQLKSLPDGPASRDAAGRLLSQRRT